MSHVKQEGDLLIKYMYDTVIVISDTSAVVFQGILCNYKLDYTVAVLKVVNCVTSFSSKLVLRHVPIFYTCACTHACTHAHTHTFHSFFSYS